MYHRRQGHARAQISQPGPVNDRLLDIDRIGAVSLGLGIRPLRSDSPEIGRMEPDEAARLAHVSEDMKLKRDSRRRRIGQLGVFVTAVHGRDPRELRRGSATGLVATTKRYVPRPVQFRCRSARTADGTSNSLGAAHLLEVFLVIVLGFEEGRCRCDLGDDLAPEPARTLGLGQ